jgi:hypothetical protein
MARRLGILPMLTRSQLRQLHPTRSKKRNVVACHRPSTCPTARQETQLRMSTTRHESLRIQRSTRWPGHLPPDTTGWSSA